MRRIGVTTASRLTAIGVVAVALVVPTRWTSAAQPPAQPPATPAPAAQPAGPPTTPSFTGDAGIMNFYIKAEKTGDFEAVMAKYKEALNKSDNAENKSAAAGLKLYKSLAPGPQGSTVYILMANPVVKGMDYSANGVVKVLTSVFPSEATQLYQQLKDAYVGHQPLNVQPVLDFSK
jgi:hypothetical protein